MTTKAQVEEAGINYKNSGVDCGMYISADMGDACLTGGYYVNDDFIKVDCIELLETGATSKTANKELNRSVKQLDRTINEAVKLLSAGSSGEPSTGIDRAIINLKANFN